MSMLVVEKAVVTRIHIFDMDYGRNRRYTDEGIEILDEQIVYQNNSFCQVRRWLRGIHPQYGVIIMGYTGWETLVEKDVIKPIGTFSVNENI